MSPALLTLEVSRFGALGCVRVGPLGRLNVLVGPSGSGKSTILQALGFLGDAARAGLPAAVAKHGGLERLCTRREPDADSRSFSIRVEAAVTRYASATAPDTYSLGVLEGGTRPTLHRETVEHAFTPRKRRRISLMGGKLRVHDDGRRHPRHVQLDPDAFALGEVPGLAWPEGCDRLLPLKELFTGLRRGDGDDRAPSLARASSPAARLTLIEEVDRGLSSPAAGRLVDELRRASAATQILVTTQSTAFAALFRPEERVVLERDAATGLTHVAAGGGVPAWAVDPAPKST